MAVALDAVTNLGTLGTSGSNTESVTLDATAKAVFVALGRSGNNSVGFSEVRWGTSSGTLFTHLGTETFNFPSGESCSMQVWYSLNDDIPGSGAQDIWNDNTTTLSYNIAVSYKAGADVAITTDGLNADGSKISSASVTDPSATIALGGVSSAVFQALISGAQAVGDITEPSGWSAVEIDMGAQQLAVYTYDTVGTDDVTYGWTQTSEDARAVAVAIYEVSSGETGTGSLTTGVTTASGSGTLTHTGTGSLTSGVTTLSGAGTLTHTGTGALTTSAVTLAGEGEIVGAVSGTGDLTTGVTTLSGSGVISHIGTGSLTVGNVTASGTGTAGSGIGVPANLEGTPTSTTIVWTWDAVSGATGYEIEYGPDGGGYTVTDVGDTLTYTQTSLSAATLYEARVRAYVDTVSDRIILESGDGYLLESGDSLLQEAA